MTLENEQAIWFSKRIPIAALKVCTQNAMASQHMKLTMPHKIRYDFLLYPNNGRQSLHIPQTGLMIQGAAVIPNAADMVLGEQLNLSL